MGEAAASHPAGSPVAPLRVALYGNMCNFLYQIAKVLRRPDAEGLAIDAHLFIERSADMQNLPESDDPEMQGGYPAWIHVDDWMHGSRRAQGVVLPWTLPLVRRWREFDLLVVSAEGPGAAPFAKRPYLFISGGGDLTLMPFAERYAALDEHPSVAKSIAWRLRAHWQRRGIKRASTIATQPFTPFLQALDALGIPRARMAGVTSLLSLDTERFRRMPREHASAVPMNVGAMATSDFVLFHPSRLMIRDTPVLRATGQWKANDALLRGFAQFVREGSASRPVLALIDRVHSPDVALARQLITELGIEAHVVWLKGHSAQGFTRHELMALYSMSDVVADDFGAGWFGSVALEACATECAVLTFVDEAAMAQMYPSHPFVNARTPPEIATALARLHTNPSERADIGRRSRDWVCRHHGMEQEHNGIKAEVRRLAGRGA